MSGPISFHIHADSVVYHGPLPKDKGCLTFTVFPTAQLSLERQTGADNVVPPVFRQVVQRQSVYNIETTRPDHWPAEVTVVVVQYTRGIESYQFQPKVDLIRRADGAFDSIQFKESGWRIAQ